MAQSRPDVPGCLEPPDPARPSFYRMTWKDQDIEITADLARLTPSGQYPLEARIGERLVTLGEGDLRRFRDREEFHKHCRALDGEVDWLAKALELAEKLPSASAQSQERLPLYRELSPAEPYPLDALGSLLGNMAKILAEVVKAPDALCGQSVLSATAVAVQAHGNVVVDGRIHPTSGYAVSIAESGERKTTADNYALYPHRQYEKSQHDGHTARYQAFANDEESYRRQRDQELRKAKSLAAKREALKTLGPAPILPMEPAFLVQEPTYEGLIKLLLVARPTIGLFSDEGGRFICGYGMSPDHRIKTAAGLSDLWDGKAISRVRAGDTTAMLFGRRLSVHLMAQPHVAMQLLGSTDLLDQGLLSRCLVAWPASLAGTRTYRAYDVTQDKDVQAYNARMTAILQAPLPLEKDQHKRETRVLQPHKITLAPQAKKCWEAFYNHVESQLGDTGALAAVRGFGSKLAEHALRLAGILTLVGDLEAKQIGADQMNAGITLAEFYVSEALRVFGQAAGNPDLEIAQRFLTWAQQHQHIYLRQIYQQAPRPIRDKATAHKFVAILEQHGWLARVDGGMKLDGSHRRDVWSVAAV